MNNKKTFFTEAAYFIGLAILAVGTALMERADFGMSMVVAPAYLLHLKIAPVFPAFTFGMAEYCLQAVLLVLLCLVLRRFRPVYLFSFITAVLYGFMLDLSMACAAPLPMPGLAGRAVFYVLGMVMGSIGVAMLFRTYIAPEAYELFVKEVSAKFALDIHKTKTVYDCCSYLISVALSFAFFGLGHFEGIKWGTIVCALVNGFLIGKCSGVMERLFEFRDALSLRKWFE